MRKNMKRKTAALALILALIAILTFTLVACNPDKLTATFELDNDGIADFALRRGVVFNYKVSALNKIDGVSASWQVENNGKVQIKVSGVKGHSDEVRSIIDSEPDLIFKTENSASAPAQFLGKGNVKSVTLSYDKSNIQIEFMADATNTVNDYLGRPLYIFLGDEYLVTMTSKMILSSSSATVTISVPDNPNPIYPDTLTAQLNAGAFGIKVKNKSVK